MVSNQNRKVTDNAPDDSSWHANVQRAVPKAEKFCTVGSVQRSKRLAVIGAAAAALCDL